MFRELWITLQLLIDTLLSGVADVTQIITRVQGLNRTEVQVYLAGLQRLALVCIFLPVPILIIGIVGGLGWLVALVGIFWAVCTLLLSALGGILPILIEVLRKIVAGLPIEKLKKVADGLEGVGQRYIHLVQAILLTELVFTLLVAVIPIQNNLTALPVLAISGAILGVLALMGMKTLITKKLIRGFATIVLVGFTLSFFFPQSFKTFEKTRVKMDDAIQEKGAAKGSLIIIKDFLWKSPPKLAPYVPSYQRIASKDFIGKGFGGKDSILWTGWLIPETARQGDVVKYKLPKGAYIELPNQGSWYKYDDPEVKVNVLSSMGEINLKASKNSEIYVELWGIC